MAQVQKRLIARGELGTGWSAAVQAAQVHTVLVNSGTDKSGVAAKAGHGDAPSAKPAGANKSSTAGTPQAMRIASGGLVYSGILRQADFTGGFRAETADGTIRANQGTVYLKPQDAAGQTAVQTAGKALPAATPAEPLAAAPSLTGSVERVVATGDVEIDQPGMHATGARLVYTASDQVSVLTGTASVPPKAVGQQGTTTGAALRFHSGDNSVEALGSVAGEPSQRVRTESKISGEGKKEKDRP
jgi:lipopolysaccharide export system protein LptA